MATLDRESMQEERPLLGMGQPAINCQIVPLDEAQEKLILVKHLKNSLASKRMKVLNIHLPATQNAAKVILLNWNQSKKLKKLA